MQGVPPCQLPYGCAKNNPGKKTEKDGRPRSLKFFHGFKARAAHILKGHLRDCLPEGKDDAEVILVDTQ